MRCPPTKGIKGNWQHRFGQRELCHALCKMGGARDERPELGTKKTKRQTFRSTSPCVLFSSGALHSTRLRGRLEFRVKYVF
jgi:hypothetical protein